VQVGWVDVAGAGGVVEPEPGRPGPRHPRLAEAVLTAALAASLIALVAVLLAGVPGHSRASSPSRHPAATHSAAAGTTPAPRNAAVQTQASALPPAVAAAGAFVGDLQAAVADGQVTPQAGQDLFNHLQQLLFGPPGQNTQQIQQQYEQLIQAYDQRQSQGQITGPGASRLRHALQALGTALGAL